MKEPCIDRIIEAMSAATSARASETVDGHFREVIRVCIQRNLRVTTDQLRVIGLSVDDLYAVLHSLGTSRKLT